MTTTQKSHFPRILRAVLSVLCSIVLVTVCASVEWAVSPARAAAEPPTVTTAQAGSFEGEPISLKVVQISVVDFFRTISELSGLNVLIDPDVSGTLTLNVEQVPWDQLFEVVLLSQGLSKKIEGNLVRISTAVRLRSEEAAEQALRQSRIQAIDTITVSRRLNYATGEQIMPVLQAHLTDRGGMNVDPRTNTLIISDIPSGVEQVSELLGILDVPEKQVEIEARIIEASTNFARELGIELGFSGGVSGVDRVQGDLGSVNTRSQGSVFLRGSLTAGRIGIDTVVLDALVEAAETKGQARILSKPRVTAQNNAQATITQGSQIPVPVQQNFTTTVQFQTAALQLIVTPRVTNVESILLDIRVENNVPDFSSTVLGIPAIRTSQSQTLVEVADGGTTVIGGIFIESETENENRVPGLGSIPVIGNLFKSSRTLRDTREIIFFITSRIQK